MEFVRSHIGGKSILISRPLLERTDQNIESHCLMITTPRHVSAMSVECVIQAIGDLYEKPIRVVDSGHVTSSQNKRGVYVVLDNPTHAQEIGKYYRIRVSITDDFSCMARIQLMSDHAVNIRLDNVPPIVKPEHIAEYLSSLGSVELIEQVFNPRANYNTDSYVIVIVPHDTNRLLQEQRNPYREFHIKGKTYRIKYTCEDMESFCSACTTFGHVSSKCPKKGMCFICESRLHKSRS